MIAHALGPDAVQNPALYGPTLEREELLVAFFRGQATNLADLLVGEPEAAREVRDLSVFRLLTNFVRAKRIAGEG